MSDAASSASNELALYAVGFVVGVGGIVLFLAVQLGILDIPFLPKVPPPTLPRTRPPTVERGARSALGIDTPRPPVPLRVPLR